MRSNPAPAGALEQAQSIRLAEAGPPFGLARSFQEGDGRTVRRAGSAQVPGQLEVIVARRLPVGNKKLAWSSGVSAPPTID